MAREWTLAQKSAIDTWGRDLLVSAGAGSGKTAVLTERIIKRLTDETAPADISRMLVVTFTKAAAGELKERISAAITEALAKQPRNRRLARQLTALDRAKISTIHSFCLDVLKECAGISELPDDFRIADAAEIALLRHNIMDELIDDYFAGNVTDYPIENFEEFADTFVGTKSDDGLADIFLKLETKLSSFTEHIDFIKNSAAEIRGSGKDFSKSRFAREILDLVKSKFTVYRDTVAPVMSEITDDDKLNKAYFTAFSHEIEYCDDVLDAIDSSSYQDVASSLNSYTAVRLGVVRNATISQELENAKSARTAFSKDRDAMSKKFFSLTPEQLEKNCIETASMLEKLHTLLSVFLARFDAEKRSRSIVDFGDLERLTYRLLVSDGKPTGTAKAIAEKFDEIYIDEYQDVNAVQDAIFTSVSNGRNRFMVGDIKQSIYSFRGAEPHIFSEYRNRFGRVGDGHDDLGAAIFLSDNFRCDNSVIEFSNLVSKCLFTGGRGDIPFYDEDMLIHSKKDTESGEPCRVVLIDGAEDESDNDVSEREAEYIAGEIARLIREEKKNNGEPIKPGDIAILMRSAKSNSPVFEAVFERRGIPCYNSEAADFFENAEVLLALCILNIIDNPTRDIYLAGALRSPVFDFSLDELIMIRRHQKEGSLYDALRAFADAENHQKSREFLGTLECWREKSVGLPVDRLLWYIYTDTDLLALVYDKENSVRRANLMLLYEYARRFEASSFKGLYNFIRYLTDILEEKAQLENAAMTSEDSDTVKLMTIHHSKGLEYPVCFIVGTGKKFNAQDLSQNIIIERSLGIAPKLSDTTGFARYDTPIRQALVKRLSDSQLEEEMRVLYVAMTRARERLYVTALVKDTNKLVDSCANDAAHLSRYVIMKNGGYMRWILTALEHSKLTSDKALPVKVEIVAHSETIDNSPDISVATVEETSEPDAELASLVRERFDFVYPSSAASKLPAKLSVSKLVPTLLDEDAAELPEPAKLYSFTEKRPMFLDTNTSVPVPTGAERGTATHLFMQFCDFSRFAVFCDDIAKEIEEEAARLAECRFFTRRMASLINVKQLTRFFEGETFADICASKSIWREHRFNVKLPASDFTENAELAKALENEAVLVQGVIDCFYENPDGTITLIDYKTDFIPHEMPCEEAEAMLLERHRMQLLYYKAACEKISAKKVSRVAIYSFGLGRVIEVK